MESPVRPNHPGSADVCHPEPPAPNWFDQGGDHYARFRPDYPPELAARLTELAPDTRLAIDVGCGNGQFTRQLAEHFDRVIGVDPSADQIAHAPEHARVAYQCAPAEKLPVPAHSASLVTAAQAAHWFDLPAFYAEARRVAQPGALLALISYGVLSLAPALNHRFARFYQEEIGPYWPAERQLVDSGYATLDFPFAEIAPPTLQLRRAWTLSELLGYIGTWSAARRAREAGREDLLRDFAGDLARLWGDPQARQAVLWPVNLRLGRL
jgi:SAM-dependent methyltransferase